MVPGVILALGTTALSTVMDLWLLTYTLWRVTRTWPDWRSAFQTHPLVLTLAGLIGITAFWSADPLAAIALCGRIILLYSLFRTWRPTGHAWLLAGTVLAVQAGFMGYQLLDDPRPHGMSFTASSAGQAGLVYAVGPLAPLGAITLGLSGARSAAFGLMLMTFLSWRSKRTWAIAALAGSVFLATAIFNDYRHGHIQSPTAISDSSRISASGISDAIQDRIDITTGNKPPTQYVTDRCGEIKPYRWQPWGFGYHSYCFDTGLPKPHNLWVLSWWEMGLLALPVWAIVFYGAWRIRNPMIVALIAVGMITEEMWSRPEGAYTIAIGMMAFKHARSIADLRLRWPRLRLREPRPHVPPG